MIPISKIDDNLNIYLQADKIIAWGASSVGAKLKTKLDFFNIKIDYWYDSNKNKWGTMYLNKPVISLEELKKLNEQKRILIQITSSYEDEIKLQLKDLGICNYIGKTEANYILDLMRNQKKIKDWSIFRKEYLHARSEAEKAAFLRHILGHISDELLIACMPMKTGDYTIVNTMNANNCPIYNTNHTPQVFNKKMIELMGISKVKIITAVRDPIAKSISKMYSFFSHLPSMCWLYDISCTDMQLIYDRHCFESQKEAEIFFDLFNTHIVNILDFSFDKEKGYSIIQTGNIEIFMYQLEKLNTIAPNLFEWAGCPNAELINDNIGEEKWYSESYKLAKQSLKFSKDFMNYCYESKYVKHFYSDEDISNFKQKWSGHIL